MPSQNSKSARVLFSHPPLIRAKQTAEIVFGSFESLPALTEVNLGELELKTNAQVIEISPSWRMFRDGWIGGETLTEVRERCDAILSWAANLKSEQVFAVTHGQPIKSLVSVALAGDLSIADGIKVENLSITTLQVDEKDWRLVSSSLV